MARVRIITKGQASTEVKDIYDKLEKNGAKIINLYRVLAHNPGALLNFLRMGNHLLTGASLPARLRELAILRIAKLSGSDYEWTQHLPIARQAGVTAEQVDSIQDWVKSGAFSETERALLRYTDEVSQQVKVSDETFGALKKHLDEQAIVELTLSIGYWGLVARVLVPLEVDIDTEIGSASELTGKKSK